MVVAKAPHVTVEWLIWYLRDCGETGAWIPDVANAFASKHSYLISSKDAAAEIRAIRDGQQSGPCKVVQDLVRRNQWICLDGTPPQPSPPDDPPLGPGEARTCLVTHMPGYPPRR